MPRFDRACAITVGPQAGDGVRVDQRFRIAITVDQDESTDGNRVTAEIYGLSSATRDRMRQEGQIIVVEAGYVDQTEVLSISEVTRVTVQRQPPEIITVIEAVDGGPALAGIRVSLSYEAGYSVQQVVEQIARTASIPLRVAPGVSLRDTFQSGNAYSGTVRGALDQTLARVDADWSIQDGELVIKRTGEQDSQTVVVLSPQTGLINSPEPLEDDGDGAGYRVEAFMQPRIRPGRLVQIDSADVSGIFVCRRVTHSGDTRGTEWLTTAEVFEA